MNANRLLSIVIPTYDRAELLDQCLALQIPVAREFCIAIYVSDNASSDHTKMIVEKRMLDYSNIKYVRNCENVGPDRNFEMALKMPDTEYIWLMGDTYHIPRESINFISERISNRGEIDCFVFNVEGRVRDVKGRQYKDCGELLVELGWHMTCMASLVYSRRLIEGANFKRYRETFFIQTGILFEYISDRDFVVEWVDCVSVVSVKINGLNKKSWQFITFDVWVGKWMNFVLSLPATYESNSKFKCIMNHGVKSGLFSLRSLVNLKVAGVLNYRIFKKYLNLFKYTVPFPLVVLILILLIPRAIFSSLITINRVVRGICIKVDTGGL